MPPPVRQTTGSRASSRSPDASARRSRSAGDPAVRGVRNTRVSNTAMGGTAPRADASAASASASSAWRVNCYLIEDEPLTLVDTGPNSGKALDDLQRQLGEHGHAIEDLELVILTHQHIDHLGLVEIVAEHSGAEVAAIDVAVRRLANFGEDAEREDEFAAGLMRRHGIPENVVYALQSVSRSFRGWGAKANVTRPLRDGEDLELRDRSLRSCTARATAPRTRSSGTGAEDPARRRPPDRPHLLQPADQPPPRRLEERTQALVTYIDSLSETRETAGGDRPLRPRRPDHRPREADRRAPGPARAAHREALSA